MKYYYYKYKLRFYEFAIIFAMKFSRWDLIYNYVNIRKDVLHEIRKYY